MPPGPVSGLTDSDLWVWVLGIVATLLVGGAAAWATAINKKLDAIAEAANAKAESLAELRVKVDGILAREQRYVTAELYHRFDSEVGRRLGGLEDQMSRLHTRLDGIVRHRAEEERTS